MLLYTPMALEDIFPAQSDPNPLVELWVDGRLCLLRRGSDGVSRLERLLSTDPRDYWNPEYQPGNVILF